MKLSSNEGDRKTKHKIYSMLYGSWRKTVAKRYILTLCQSYFQALNFIFLGISATKNLCKPLKYCTINASWWKTQYLNPHCSKSAYIQPETKKCLYVANSSFFLIWPCHRAWKIIVPPLQELNLHPWQWKCGVQTIGPSGNSQILTILYKKPIYSLHQSWYKV